MATRIEKTDLARDALYDKVNTMIDEVNTKIDNKDSLPSQTGNTGKFLTTDGTNASWGEVKQIEIKQDLTSPSADTVPSTKAVKDESSRITTLMNNKIGEKMNKDASNITSSAKSTISGWSMPSGRFIDLTLGASGTSYTAPANGFFFVEKLTQEAGQFLIFNTANMEQESIAVFAGNWVGGFVPVKKGMNCKIQYTASGATKYFRFIYAEGE